MSITKIERKYMDAKFYILAKIIAVAEKINYRKTIGADYDEQKYLFDYLCYLYTNAFNELITSFSDADEKIERIVVREEVYMIRKFNDIFDII